MFIAVELLKEVAAVLLLKFGDIGPETWKGALCEVLGRFAKDASIMGDNVFIDKELPRLSEFLAELCTLKIVGLQYTESNFLLNYFLRCWRSVF